MTKGANIEISTFTVLYIRHFYVSPPPPPQCSHTQNADFGAYVTYCKNKPTSDNARVDYETFFSRRQSELGQKLSIEDLLITPVQRLPKYQLLIRVSGRDEWVWFGSERRLHFTYTSSSLIVLSGHRERERETLFPAITIVPCIVY